MSKKSKRQIRKDPGSAAVVETSSPTFGSMSSRVPAFNPDYTYILKDLRRIAVLAISFVAVLIVLSLVLPK